MPSIPWLLPILLLLLSACSLTAFLHRPPPPPVFSSPTTLIDPVVFPPPSPSPIHQCCPDGIDVVWTWVNGSDPAFIARLNSFQYTGSPSRFRDYNTLVYSLRSVYAYAPYIRNYYIVTDAQIPSFIDLNISSVGPYRLRIVDHHELFSSSVLPTFNSNAIESVLHAIPGLSECFLYLNDDMLLGSYLPPDFFIDTTHNRLVFYHNNNHAPDARDSINLWHRGITHSNAHLNVHFGHHSRTPHPYPAHHCYFFSRSTLAAMADTFKPEYEITRSHHFRRGDDVVIPFSYGFYATETKKTTPRKEHGNFYTVVKGVSGEAETLRSALLRRPRCVCLNDGLGALETNESLTELARLRAVLDAFYPVPSPFERKHNQFNVKS